MSKKYISLALASILSMVLVGCSVNNNGWADDSYEQLAKDRIAAGLGAECVFPASPNYKSRVTIDPRQGEFLKRELHLAIRNNKKIKKKDTWRHLAHTDEDPDNPGHVLLLYKNWSLHKDDHGNGGNQWSREHVWAKSIGGFGWSPMAGTDLHNLRPCDKSVNSTRSDLSFDNGGDKEYIDAGYPTGCFYDSNSWEPPDRVKGDVARIMFYMAVRYERGPDLELLDRPHARSAAAKRHGVLSTLLEWHRLDPPDCPIEQMRNDRIEAVQGNRNPFIDNPEYAYIIWQ
ncbi:MAG: endonuclease [Planctomycetota bacterium]